MSWAVTGGVSSRGGTHARYPKAAQAAQSGLKTDTGIGETGPGAEATHITQERWWCVGLDLLAGDEKPILDVL